MGDVVLRELLTDRGLLPSTKQTVDYYLIAVTPEQRGQVLALAHRLRDTGASVDYGFRAQGIGKQFKNASALGARRRVVLGPDELAEGVAVVKDMESGKESRVPLAEPGGVAYAARTGTGSPQLERRGDEFQTKLITAHEFYWTPDNSPTRSELIRGVVHRRPFVGMLQSHISGNVMFPLAEYVETRRLGISVGRTGFWVERDPDSVLAPTFAFVRADRYPEPGPEEHDFYFPGPPDLAGEVVSDQDPPEEVEARVDRWLRAGTEMVILVHIDRRTVNVYRPGAEPVVLAEGDVLDGADVIPGWRRPVSHIFDVRLSRMAS